jgi:hypothetical protein
MFLISNPESITKHEVVSRKSMMVSLFELDTLLHNIDEGGSKSVELISQEQRIQIQVLQPDVHSIKSQLTDQDELMASFEVTATPPISFAHLSSSIWILLSKADPDTAAELQYVIHDCNLSSRNTRFIDFLISRHTS